MGESRPEKPNPHPGGIVIVEEGEVARGIPAQQLVEIIGKLDAFSCSEVPHVHLALWDIVMDTSDKGVALYAVAPDPQDRDAEFVAYWHFAKIAWVWEA
jgi:hypothetical protein